MEMNFTFIILSHIHIPKYYINVNIYIYIYLYYTPNDSSKK